MAKITLNLIPAGQYPRAWRWREEKEKDLYRKACGIIEMDNSDFKKSGAGKIPMSA